MNLLNVSASCKVENDMNSRDIVLPIINLDSEQALPLISSVLSGLEIQVLPSFDLKVARSTQDHCSCPHHGSIQCDCQMVVLLLYGQDDAPITLVIHSYDGKTFLSFIDNARHRPETGIQEKLYRALLYAPFGSFPDR